MMFSLPSIGSFSLFSGRRILKTANNEGRLFLLVTVFFFDDIFDPCTSSILSLAIDQNVWKNLVTIWQLWAEAWLDHLFSLG